MCKSKAKLTLQGGGVKWTTEMKGRHFNFEEQLLKWMFVAEKSMGSPSGRDESVGAGPA